MAGSKLWVDDVATSTTAGSTTLPEGAKLISISNIDGTNNISISAENAIGTANNPEATLTPTNDTLDFSTLRAKVGADTIYHQSNAGTPILRIIAYID